MIEERAASKIINEGYDEVVYAYDVQLPCGYYVCWYITSFKYLDLPTGKAQYAHAIVYPDLLGIPIGQYASRYSTLKLDEYMRTNHQKELDEVIEYIEDKEEIINGERADEESFLSYVSRNDLNDFIMATLCSISFSDIIHIDPENEEIKSFIDGTKGNNQIGE